MAIQKLHTFSCFMVKPNPPVCGFFLYFENEKYPSVQFPESSVRPVRAVGSMDTTGQIVMQTKVETRSFNDSHTFRVSKAVEFFLKFEVPENQIAALEADPERHIFQVVKIFIHFFFLKIFTFAFAQVNIFFPGQRPKSWSRWKVPSWPHYSPIQVNQSHVDKK